MNRPPVRTVRLHLSPYWLGDSPAAIQKAGKRGKRGRSPYIDLNLQTCLDGVVGLHWGAPRRGDWCYIEVGNGKRRKLTDAELDRHLRHWRKADVVRLRQTKRRGLSYRSRVRPLTYVELLQSCKRYGAVPCFELKADEFGQLSLAAQVVTQARALRVEAWFMTLATMPRWRAKAKAFHAAGSPIALLAHNSTRPHDLDDYYPAIVGRIWGAWK